MKSKRFPKTVLSVLCLTAFGCALPLRGEPETPHTYPRNPEGYIGGDGGPMIVLQASAAAKWQGTGNDWENSKVETDYDVVCKAKGHGQVIRRYNREMLVLDDSEWGARIATLNSGATAIVQRYGEDEETTRSVVARVTKRRPTKSFRMKIEDHSLRLLVGADEGNGTMYGYKDVPITAGIKRCDLFSSKDELVIVIKPLGK